MLHNIQVARSCIVIALSFIFSASAVWPVIAQSSPENSNFTIGTRFAFSAGNLLRGGSSFLRTELSGVVVNPHLIELDNNENYGSFYSGFVIEFPTPELFRPVHGDTEEFIFGSSRTWSNVYSMRPFVSAGGNQTAILSSLANGPLAGGVVTTANFGDVFDFRYDNEFDLVEYHAGKRYSYQAGSVEIKPSLWVQYGHIDIKELFSGRTNGNTLFFQYNNKTESKFYGVGAGVDIEFPVGDLAGIPVEFYGGAWVMPQFHKFGGYSKLMVTGFNAETKNLGGSDESVAYQAYGSLSFELTENIKFDVGARYYLNESPVLKITGVKDAEVKLEKLEQVGGFASIYYKTKF